MLAGRGSPIFNGLVSGPIFNFRDVFFNVFGGFLPLLETVSNLNLANLSTAAVAKKEANTPYFQWQRSLWLDPFGWELCFPSLKLTASLPLKISLLGRWYLSSFGAPERPIFRGFCCLVSGNVPHDIFWIAFYFWTPLTPQPLILVL